MQPLPHILTDPVFLKPRNYNRPDNFFIRFIRDERDLPFIYFTISIILFLIPYAALLFSHLLVGWYWLAAAIIYMLLNATFFIGRFSLMFHCVAHRTLFKKQFNYLNYLLPYVIAPLFGHMADIYYAHHIGMHHAENNLEEDESSTMSYQRDSLRSFLLYLIRFIITGLYDLAAYLKKKNRRKLLYSALRGEILFIVLSVVLCCFNWPATCCVFIFPYFFYRLIAMLGNWAQHAFIDPADPGNPVVFSKVDIMMVAVLLLGKRYDLLARNFVNIGNRFASEEAVVEFLKERTTRFTDY